ncbi:DUF4394 domain-containing protein [Algoriphagus aestuariicola]|uniref:DUF4394 domain-containing protein n=1 Tax=Algoriphagus aestuariicola TaxID=1852016 RepID=A0ABS3BTL6_9BACT|nr:DUF4394 domain-containing protein [Algoriphagus aestuariicola]MBN7801029.1 DUF4394 domain-containing protein [Algoriphagus aestuariicola]
MKKLSFHPIAFAVAVSAAILFSCNEEENPPLVEMPGMTPEVNFTALAEGNQLLYFEEGNLSAPVATVNITGLSSGESLISIDYRPATGQLYALSSLSRIYFINENSGVATPLGASAFTPAIEGEMASIDFNPTVDRIRLVAESGQNLRLHPETGAVVATDGRINGGTNPVIGAVAYTNSVSGASSTVLFDIDIATDKLYQQVPPNDGGLMEVGDLGVDLDGSVDLDILADNSLALAVNRSATDTRLYSIDLASGEASWVGVFSQPVISLALKTNPVAYAIDEGGMLYRFNPMNPQPTMVELQGLSMGEKIVGLDFRPANGQLLAISSNSQLYSVNPSSGVLTAIGNPLMPMMEGDIAGFDFNPTVDRIRLVTSTGQNLRLHPDLGTVVATDGRLNPGMPMVSGAAYANNIAGATTTTLFVVDHMTGSLFTQIPPNDGVLVPVGSLGITITAQNGFDIGGHSGSAFAVLTSGSASGVYSVNLTTGAATKLSDLTFSPVAMTVGLGF